MNDSEDQNDIARMLFWPVLLMGLGLILMLMRSPSGSHPLFSPVVRVSDRQAIPLVGMLIFVVGTVQAVLVCIRWWRDRRPKG